jgi:poly-gamma-glutamate synthesis protein (capsule biosynthesis protein)
MYFARLDPDSGDLLQLRMFPMQLSKMRLNRATAADVQWLTAGLARISQRFGSWVEGVEDASLLLCWK